MAGVFGAGIDGPEAVPLVKGVGGDGALTDAERPDRLHVDGAGQTLAHE